MSKAAVPPSPFLRLPLNLRQKIYSYLLAPHPEEDVITINYSLEWPFLENPRNSTFTPHQLDLCRCPQQQPRLSNIQTKDHIYTRYICQQPTVRFTPKGGDLWLLQAPNGVLNILRPASKLELLRRPRGAAILQVNKIIYQEALPFLYGGRNFLFLTGPCPRGRYQAYATQVWLSRLSPFARDQITDLSLLCQVWEEDCRDRNALKAYASLSQYILENVSRFKSLCLNHWSEELPVHPFSVLFRKEEVRIFVNTTHKDGKVSEFCDASSFLKQYGEHSSADLGRMKRLKHRQDRKMCDLGDILEDSSKNRALHGKDSVAEFQEDVGSYIVDESQRKLSLGDDWVLAGMSPTGSSGEIDSDVWEVI